MFIEDYPLKVARKFDALPEHRKREIPPERQAQIREREAIVLQRYGRGPGTMSVMVGLEQMCRDLSEGQQQEPASLWEYDNYYREASNYSHPTMWHICSYRAELSPITEIKPRPETGFRALLVAGGCFLRALQQWNHHFKRLADGQPLEWLIEWNSRVTQDKVRPNS